MIFTCFAIFFLVVSLNHAEAQSSRPCNLQPSLLNQDPYPAVPGDYVKLVFQLDGLDNPNCGDISFELLEEFPLSFDPDQKRIFTASSGTTLRNFQDFLLAPFEVRVDENALDGENLIEARYAHKLGTPTELFFLEDFNITVEDVRVDFEVSIKDYQTSTNTLTFEILNIGKTDIEALTIEIPKQDNIVVKGTKRNIVGSLDSKEDTTFSFEAIPQNGEIELIIFYSDLADIRRDVTKTVDFDSIYFEDRAGDNASLSPTFYAIAALIVLIILIWIRRIWKRRKSRHKKR